MITFSEDYMKCRSLLIIFVFLFLTNCVDSNLPKYTVIRFDQQPKLSFDVGKIQVVETYQSSRKLPYVEHLFPVSMTKSIDGWVKDRMVATGEHGFMRVNIREASVTEEPLPMQKGVFSSFNEPQNLYKAKIVVSFEWFNDNDLLFPKAEFVINLDHREEIDRNASSAVKKELFYRLYKHLIRDFNSKVEQNIANYF